MPTSLRARPATADVAGKNGHSLISSQKFRQLYAALLKYELLGEHLRSICANGAEAGQGQFAGAVGVMLGLERDDTVVLSPRTHAVGYVKGVPFRDRLNHHNGGSANGASFRCTSAHVLMPASTGADEQVGLATGVALANKIAKNGKIAVGFMDGGAGTLENCTEAFELAADRRLPLLFVAQARPDRRHEKALTKLSELFPVITVDGNDVVAVYRVAQESIQRAREGCPALIACLPYKPNGAIANPVEIMEQYLTAKRLFENTWKEEAVAEFHRELDAACVPLSNPLA